VLGKLSFEIRRGESLPSSARREAAERRRFAWPRDDRLPDPRIVAFDGADR